jgi:hypothetical protein
MPGEAINRGGSLLWIMLLTAASVLTSWALACATPFAALAALAALHMARREGLILMAVAWFASQAVGFGIHHYPQDRSTLMWGGVIGLAAIASLLAARWAISRVAGGAVMLLGAAFVGAVLGYKSVIIAGALGLGGLNIALSLTYFARDFVRDGAIMIALLMLYRVLTAVGVPAASRRKLAAI